MGTTGYSEEMAAHVALVRQARGWTEDYVVTEGTVTQTEVQRSWGATLHRVRRGEVVTVSENGRPDVVILDHQTYQDLLRDLEEMKGR